MNRFRDAVIVVVAAFAVTYGVIGFILYRKMLAYQLHPQPDLPPPKFPPEAAWIFAAVDTLLIFVAIALIGFMVIIVSTIWRFFRARHRNHSV
jgi:hypothetical protein